MLDFWKNAKKIITLYAYVLSTSSTKDKFWLNTAANNLVVAHMDVPQLGIPVSVEFSGI